MMGQTPEETSSKVRVRRATNSDSAAIRRVHEQAFPSPIEARLVALLAERRREIVSLVAVTEDGIVGHVLFTPVTVETAPGGFRAAGLAPVAVRPEWQRQGIGHTLVREGLARCRRSGIDAVVVLGEPGYYAKFGFVAASRFGLDSVYGAGDAFMALELTPGTHRNVGGIVRYCPEFDEVLNR